MSGNGYAGCQAVAVASYESIANALAEARQNSACAGLLVASETLKIFAFVCYHVVQQPGGILTEVDDDG